MGDIEDDLPSQSLDSSENPVFPTNNLAGTGNNIQLQPRYNTQGSHSLAYKKFQDFFRTPKTFFHDSVVA